MHKAAMIWGTGTVSGKFSGKNFPLFWLVVFSFLYPPKKIQVVSHLLSFRDVKSLCSTEKSTLKRYKKSVVRLHEVGITKGCGELVLHDTRM